MGTENTPDTTDDAAPAIVVMASPTTGEIVDLNAPASILADQLEQIAWHLEQVAAFRSGLVDELARRADALGQRTVEVDGVRYETNRPTEDVYDIRKLADALQPLIEEGRLSPRILDELIVQPVPRMPPMRVDKRRLNVLLGSDDRTLLAALASARTRVAQTRTVKVVARATDTTAIEEGS